jgi:two-component system, cell cycle sensor histidine kinase and response regulator CckA
MSAIAQLHLKADGSADGLQTEQQLRDAHKMEAIGRLVGGVAHDFNNLLTGMVLCSELILAGLDKDNRLRRFAEEIRSAGEQGAGLIQQLMAVARQRAVEPCLLCMNDVVSEVRNLLTRLIGENVELIAELADDLGLVRMDPAEVQQIILNLVLNARDAMPDGGRVTLITRNCDEPGPGPGGEQKQFRNSWIEFAVSDTGCGMDAETRAHLFEPFFTTKKPGKGNGLGLATVYRIVTHQGGTIKVESESGRGTRVAVHLPRTEALFQPSSVPRARNEISPVPNQKVRGPRKGKTRGRGESV